MWGSIAAFVMYNLVFWDWMPTVAIHKYYCETESGFWVNKTPNQWAKENPGVLETLEPFLNPVWGGAELKGGRADRFNDRFGKLDTRKENLGGFLVQRKEISVIDLSTQEILARRVDFLSGPRKAGVIWKSWLRKDSCFTYEQQAIDYSAQHDLFVQLRMMEGK